MGRVLAYYNGKVVDMAYAAPKQFALGCARVLDNARSGYVLDRGRLYRLVTGRKLAMLVTDDEERERVCAEIDALPVEVRRSKAGGL